MLSTEPRFHVQEEQVVARRKVEAIQWGCQKVSNESLGFSFHGGGLH